MSEKKEMKSDVIRVRLAEGGITEQDVKDALEWARGGSERGQTLDENGGPNR